MDWAQIFSVLGLLIIILLVLAGAWIFTRWAGQNLGGGFPAVSRSGRLRVLDRAGVGRDQSLLVVRAGQRYLLLGSTPAGLTLLAELTAEEGKDWDPPQPPDGPEQKRPMDFRALMRQLRDKK